MFITGEMNFEMLAEFLVALKELDSSKGAIRINITSNGGDVGVGFAMYDAIRSTQNKVITRGIATIGSMAVLLLQAGDLRLITPTTSIMLHDGSISMQHSLLAARDIMVKAIKDHKTYIGILAQRSGLSYKEVENLCSKENFFDAKTTLNLGLVDAIQNNRPFENIPIGV